MEVKREAYPAFEVLRQSYLKESLPSVDHYFYWKEVADYLKRKGLIEDATTVNDAIETLSFYFSGIGRSD